MDKPKTRLHIEADFSEGADIALNRDQVHFLVHVLRLKTGDHLSLFNADGGEWLASITDHSRRRGVVHLHRQMRGPESEPGPWLAFAPIKKTRTDFIVEKATELGVEKLIPVFTRFTASTRVNVERLTSIAREAAEQCGRLTVPEVAEPCDLADLLDNWPEGRRLFIGDETGKGVPLSTVLAGGPPEHGFLIGPEGGFSEDELVRVKTQVYADAIDLGPRVLRAETAAIAALAGSQALTGIADRLSQNQRI